MHVAMELCQGVDLSKVIDKAHTQNKHYSLPFRDTKEICRQMLCELEYIHAHDIIHRGQQPFSCCPAAAALLLRPFSGFVI